MEEWTEVKAKTSRRSRANESTTNHSACAPDRDATVETISREFDRHRAAWRKSTARSAVYQILHNLHVLDSPSISIKKAICLALGSFSRNNLETRRRSMAQLACFIDVVEHIESKSDGKVVLFAQDPIFTSIDRDFLKTLGFLVLDTEKRKDGIGKATDHFNSEAFVAEFCLDMLVESVEQILGSHIPLLITSAHHHVNRLLSREVSRAKGHELETAMNNSYGRYTFPQSQGQESLAFESLAILGAVPQD